MSKEDEVTEIQDFAPIPKEFYNTDTGAPFTNCLMCEKDLLKEGETYMIEKAVRNYQIVGVEDVVFEHAMCLDCMMKMRNSLSKESVAKLDLFFTQNTSLKKRSRAFKEEENFNHKDWLNNCVVTDKTSKEVSEYQIYALCNGADMVYNVFPYMVCEDATNEMQELLSKKTKDELDDFIDKHHSGPPELKELFKKKPVMII